MVGKILILMVIMLAVIYLFFHIITPMQTNSIGQNIQNKQINNFTYYIYSFHISSNGSSDILYPIKLPNTGIVNITIISKTNITITIYNNTIPIFTVTTNIMTYSFYSSRNILLELKGSYIDANINILFPQR
jgi:hypothetical protein